MYYLHSRNCCYFDSRLPSCNLKVPRVVCEISDYLAMEKRLQTTPMKIIYNRLELTSQIIPGK